MAKKEPETKMFEISITGNNTFCGVGAGGVQFAYGKAVLPEGRMCNWYKEHKGYTVTEVKAETPTE